MKEAIINILKKWGCMHKWKEWRNQPVSDDWGSNWTVTHFKCLKCGKFKMIKSY